MRLNNRQVFGDQAQSNTTFNWYIKFKEGVEEEERPGQPRISNKSVKSRKWWLQTGD